MLQLHGQPQRQHRQTLRTAMAHSGWGQQALCMATDGQFASELEAGWGFVDVGEGQDAQTTWVFAAEQTADLTHRQLEGERSDTMVRLLLGSLVDTLHLDRQGRALRPRAPGNLAPRGCTATGCASAAAELNRPRQI